MDRSRHPGAPGGSRQAPEGGAALPRDPERFTFWYHALDARHRSRSIFRCKGLVTIRTLILDQRIIPLYQIDTVDRVQDVLQIHLLGPVEGAGAGALDLTVKVAGRRAATIERLVEMRASLWQAHLGRESLRLSGQEARFRAVRCPGCQATIELTGVGESPQIWCRYCTTLFTDPRRPPLFAAETGHGLCPQCHLYGRLKEYTIFGFYVVSSVEVRHERKVLCASCARGAAWMNLLTNGPFVLGVPSSLYMLSQAYSGHAPELHPLEHANAQAARGRAGIAIRLYDTILDRVPQAAGIHYNRAVVALRSGEASRFTESCERALRNAANFQPAYALLRAYYEVRGTPDRVRELDRTYGSFAVPDEEVDVDVHG